MLLGLYVEDLEVLILATTFSASIFWTFGQDSISSAKGELKFAFALWTSAHYTSKLTEQTLRLWGCGT
jgi:hypothetical protein